MKILVIGGSGFIGTRLVEKLLTDGHKVVIFDKAPSKRFPELVICDNVCNKKALLNAAKDINVIYHLAAEHRDDVKPLSLYYDVNVGGAENVVKAAEANHINRIVFTSTVALYGLSKGCSHESDPPEPFNDYGKSKYQAEQVFKHWADKNSERSLTIIRPVVVFGEDNKGNVYNLLYQMAQGHFLMVGNGQNKKAMAYVGNISAFLASLVDGHKGISIFNYADNPNLTTQQLVSIARTALNKRPVMKLNIPYSIGIIAGYGFDVLALLLRKSLPISSIRIKKFCSETIVNTERLQASGFQPPYSLEESLKRTISNEFFS
jgi:nucleoside-diphosphate-sugar epimerase